MTQQNRAEGESGVEASFLRIGDDVIDLDAEPDPQQLAAIAAKYQKNVRIPHDCGCRESYLPKPDGSVDYQVELCEKHGQDPDLKAGLVEFVREATKGRS